MLRTSLRSVRGAGGRSIAATPGRQWHVVAPRTAAGSIAGKRCFADKKVGSDVPQPAVIPPSETRTAASSTTPPPISEANVKSASVSSDNIPRTPPAPETTPAASQSPTIAAKTTTTQVPPTPLPKKKKGFFRRLRNYILTLTILGAVTFGGGVWYSRVNDNFHDFFTEYVPYGEQAVLYLEEMDFRKRFPRIAQRGTGSGSSSSKDVSAASVKIPAQSGASWRVADEAELAPKRQSTAVKNAKAAAAERPGEKKQSAADPKEDPKSGSADTAAAAPITKPTQPLDGPITPPRSIVQDPAKESSSPKNSPSEPVKTTAIPAAATSAATAPAASGGFKAPEVDEPSRWPPASPIDPLAVPDAAEPVVQDLVRMLNDIITVINADGANERYAATIGKAKNEAYQLGRKIREIKQAAQEDAALKIKENVDNLQTYATDLIERLESHMTAQEKRWRQEFEAEMARQQETYEARVKTMTERERQLAEEKMQNRLLEQAIELQRRFTDEVRGRVEEERDARLGRLEALSSAVSELDQLTAGWNEVVDETKRTQQLHVAVEAVRASLEASTLSPSPSSAADPPRRPFVRELVALKEIANGDPVVDAAIASINPAAYQRGISSPAELVDRFRRVAAEVRKAALLPSEAGVASHASSWVLSKVMFRKQGLAEGSDVESVLTRAQTYLEEGDLDNAAREVNGLTGWAKTLSRDWLGEVRKVLEVQQALDVIQTEARLQSLRVE